MKKFAQILIVIILYICLFTNCAWSNNSIANVDSSCLPGVHIRSILQHFRQIHLLNNPQMDSLVELFHLQEEYGCTTNELFSLEGDDTLWNYFLIHCGKNGTKNFKYLELLLRLDNLNWTNVECSEMLSEEVTRSLLTNPDLVSQNWNLLHYNLQQIVVRRLQIDEDELWSSSSQLKAKRLREKLLKIK
jgi:hypothetical protein